MPSYNPGPNVEALNGAMQFYGSERRLLPQFDDIVALVPDPKVGSFHRISGESVTVVTSPDITISGLVVTESDVHRLYTRGYAFCDWDIDSFHNVPIDYWLRQYAVDDERFLANPTLGEVIDMTSGAIELGELEREGYVGVTSFLSPHRPEIDQGLYDGADAIAQRMVDALGALR